MTVTTAELAEAVRGYARTFHGVIGDKHHVASPLGAWIVLALAGPAASGAQRAPIAASLGTGIEDAAQAAGTLLAGPHPLVAAAAAVWNTPGLVDENWLAGLPGVVERGPVPGQREADEWARRHTFGLIERFPVTIDDTIYLILASALATRVSWYTPFELVSADSLGASSPWMDRIDQVLRMPAGHFPVPGHRAFIAPTQEAGDVAVHVATARGGLQVLSVAAAADVPPADVLDAAHALAIASGLGHSVQRRSLFDLPLGDGPAWTLQESRSREGDAERFTAVLPAWTARSDHDLSDPRLGFGAIAATLSPGDPWQARQAAMARYSRTGFEAAAVMAFAAGMAMRMPAEGRLRTAELRFGHPYAVVAVAAQDDLADLSARPVPPAWHGLPVFSAWIAEPGEASD